MSPEFSVRDVLAWARTKPADEEYDYTAPNNCAMCHFLRDTGRSKAPAVIPRHWRHDDGYTYFAFAAEIEGCLNPPGWRISTFGALVKRLEKLCPETPDYARIEAYLVDLESVGA